MWGEKQIANLAKTEFDVLLNPAYVQQLVQDIHEESAHLTDEEYENQLTVDYILAVMEKVYVENLQMLHPFMPFVTEAVWQEFYGKDNSILNKLLS